MRGFHKSRKALATLAVQDRETSRYLLFDKENQLCGRRVSRDGKPELAQGFLADASTKTAPASEGGRYTRQGAASAVPVHAGHSGALAFSGIHVISPRLLTMMPEDSVFSIIDTYLHLASRGEMILAFNADRFYWRDLGKPNDLKQAAEDLKT